MKNRKIFDYCKKLEQDKLKLAEENERLKKELLKKESDIQTIKAICEAKINQLSDTIQQVNEYQEKYKQAIELLKASKSKYQMQFKQYFKMIKK